MRSLEEYSKEELWQLFDYDFTTGILKWKARGNPKFDTKYAGKEIKSPDKDGYYRAFLFGKTIKAHRIIFKMIYGYLPEKVDHNDGDVTNNRKLNLRASTTATNGANSKIPKNNTSGIKGIHITKYGTFEASIQANGKRIRKTFKVLDEATDWLNKKRAELHGEFANNG